MQARAIALLRGENARMTHARKAIVDLVFSLNSPISVLKGLAKKDIGVNKTTVYRELSYLVKSNILKEVFIKPNSIHYESALLPHHHHLICNNCGSVEEVDCVINERKLLQKIKSKGFDLKTHKFELYGTCAS